VSNFVQLNTIYIRKPYFFNPLKSETHYISTTKTRFRLKNKQKFSLYLTGNTLRLGCENQPVNAVQWNSLGDTQIHSVGKIQSFGVLKWHHWALKG
jgi:hypothetical protein